MEKNGAFSLFETSVKETVTFAYIMTFHCTSVYNHSLMRAYFYLLLCSATLKFQEWVWIYLHTYGGGGSISNCIDLPILHHNTICIVSVLFVF